MALKYIESADLKGKKVIARFDFNVPLKDGEIKDTTRVDMALQTIKYILGQGASKLIMMSHLGRPKGGPDPKFSLAPVATYLAEQLSQDVVLTESATDGAIKQLINLPETKLVLLENIRFHPEETKNNEELAKTLSSYADVYVNDAFGAAHRQHSSTHMIVRYFKDHAYAGFLMKKEIEALTKITDNPKRPFYAIVGGAKVSDKIKVLERLLTNVDGLIIGGAMAYPFLKASGVEVGKSLCSDEDLDLAKKILNSTSKEKILLPLDHVVSSSPDGAPQEVSEQNIPNETMGLDIGQKTLALYQDKLSSAQTVLWNGPMGMFENPNFANGTFSIAKLLAESNAFTLIGGGDSVSAVNKSGLSSKMSHVSTGGGASLEFIEKGDLPGVQALKFGV